MHPSREFAQDIVLRLRARGHIAYFAGGCVRDDLLGVAPMDFDVATNATPKAIAKIFPRTVVVGAQFGVVVVLGPSGTSGMDVEVATFRSDGAYRDGRRPETVTFGNEVDDATRRDFTINGLFFDPVEKRVIDHVGGLEDLQRRVVRCIGDPEERFSEDKLRLIRAVRFGAQLDFEIDPSTASSIARHAEEIRLVSAERLGDELDKILVGSDPSRAIRELNRLGLLQYLLPEFSREESSSPEAIESSCRLLSEGRRRESVFRWALLLAPLHLAPDPLQEISTRFRHSCKQAERIRHVLGFPSRVSGAPSQTVAEVRRLLADPELELGLALTSAIASVWGDSAEALEFVRDRLQEIGSDRRLPTPLLTGHDLIRLGLRPGRQFAEILHEVQDLQLEKKLFETSEALEYVRSGYLK